MARGGMSNPPPALTPEPEKIQERVIIKEVIVERPVVVTEPFSLRKWWANWKEQRKRKAIREKIASGEITRGRSGTGKTREMPMSADVQIKLIKKGEK